MDDIIINLILALVKGLVKNPKKAATLRGKLLKVRDAISAVYPE